MLNYRTKILCLLAIIVYFPIFGQISNAKILLEYNIDSCTYDCSLVVTEINQNSNFENKFNASQIALVTQVSDSISIKQTINPISSNEFIAQWKLSAFIQSPEITPNSNYYLFTLQHNQAYLFDTILLGDTIKLFSIQNFGDNSQCGRDIRLFNPNFDPDAHSPGMGGYDLAPKILVDGQNIYSDILTQPLAFDSLIIDAVYSFNLDSLIFKSKSLQKGCNITNAFLWKHEDDELSHEACFTISPVYKSNLGSYEIIVSNSVGCIDTQKLITPFYPIISEDTTVCVGEQIVIKGFPQSGTWASSDSNFIQSIIHQESGIANLSFHDANAGLYSFIYKLTDHLSDTLTITVLPLPSMSIDSSFCIGESFENVYNFEILVDSNFIQYRDQNLTMIRAGYTQIILKDQCLSEPYPINIHNDPLVSVSDVNPCINTIINLTSNEVGNWENLSPQNGVIYNHSQLLTLQTGEISLLFTNENTKCKSDTLQIFVSKPIIVTVDDDQICEGSTTQIHPSVGGKWISSDSSIAIVDLFGKITGLKEGVVTFELENKNNGCGNPKTSPIIIAKKPNVFVEGDTMVCIGKELNAKADQTGKWKSLNNLVAQITDKGVIKINNAGETSFVFSNLYGCKDTTQLLTIFPRPIASIDKTEIRQKDDVQLSPKFGGTWQSSNENIAPVINTKAYGKNEGKVEFTFMEDIHGCASLPVKAKVIPRFVISGFIFTDTDHNNQYQKGIDYPLPNCAISRNNSDEIYFSDVEGKFYIRVDSGQTTIKYRMNFGSWKLDSIVRNFNVNKQTIAQYIGFKPIIIHESSLSSIAATKLLCHEEMMTIPQLYNNNSSILSSKFVLFNDPRQTGIQVNPSPIVNGPIMIWKVDSLPPGHTFSPKVNFEIYNYYEYNDSLKNNLLDISLLDNDTLSQYDFSKEVICANWQEELSKQYSPKRGKENYILNNETIIYNFTFQNIRTKDLNKLNLISKLSPFIDKRSLAIFKSSHPSYAFLKGEELHINFDTVAIPSASSDFILSQGYVSIAAGLLPNLPSSALIENHTQLYFNDSLVAQENVTHKIIEILPCSYKDFKITQKDNALSIPYIGNKFTWYDCNTNAKVFDDGNIFSPQKSGLYKVIVSGNNCLSESECYSFISTSNNEFIDNEHYVYPNPFTDDIKIYSNSKISNVRLYDTIGREVMHCDCNQVHIPNLVKGVYFLNFEINGFKKEIKVIKI